MCYFVDWVWTMNNKCEVLHNIITTTILLIFLYLAGWSWWHSWSCISWTLSTWRCSCSMCRVLHTAPCSVGGASPWRSKSLTPPLWRRHLHHQEQRTSPPCLQTTASSWINTQRKTAGLMFMSTNNIRYLYSTAELRLHALKSWLKNFMH